MVSLPSTERCNPMQDRTIERWQHAEVHAPADVAPLAQKLGDELSRAGYTDKDAFCLRLAVEEAIINGIRHGNHLEPGKKVQVRYAISYSEAVVEIEDEGSGFDPNRIADPLAPENIEKPSGRGIFLMRFYMTWVKYNERGNCVTLCRCNSARR